MASIDTLLISDPKEHKWVVEIDEIIDHQLQIDAETPSLSIFQAPETITQKKPEAYEPQQIGLGPIHHFRPQTYKKMEQKKIGVLRKVLKGHDIKDYKLHVLNKVRKFVPMVRSCYDMFLQDDDDSLARIFAIDGLFLIHLFHSYTVLLEEDKDEYLLSLKKKAYEMKHEVEEDLISIVGDDGLETILERKMVWFRDTCYPLILHPKELVVTVDNQIEWEKILKVPHHEPTPKVGPKERMVAQDILMVENQIPFMVLKEIDDTLHSSSSGNSSHSINNFSPSVFRVFCEIHSPLKLCLESQVPPSVHHLLDYMYHSIVNNVLKDQLPDDSHKMEKPNDEGESQRAGMTFSIEELYSFITKIPQKEIVKAYEQIVTNLETFSQTKVLIPSTSILHDKAGFQFHSLEEDQGIQNIRIEGKDIYLPRITLNNDSEIILRNLVAYETLTANSNSFPLNEYMGLMCGLIMTKDDAKYLKSQKVITTDMGADEVAKLFTGMSSSISTVKTKGKSTLRDVIDDINKVYESGVRMKTYLLLKKVARWLLVVLTTIGGFVGSSWKIVAFIVSIVTVFMLTMQAYCDVYGCDKNPVTLSLYASS
ncbi:hypothetical protein HanIR_Chr10g0497731 [Helianthus annuus]|nr:hypothetical protein HanIR_Chr10g0497731 [Helianthus annuus]